MPLCNFTKDQPLPFLLNFSFKGPDLPFTISSHCIIQYNSSTIFIIGGYQNNKISKRSWIIDLTNNFKLREGPSLKMGRERHSCGKMEVNGEIILVVAGGYGYDSEIYFDQNYLDSVELLRPISEREWKFGIKNFIKTIIFKKIF